MAKDKLLLPKADLKQIDVREALIEIANTHEGRLLPNDIVEVAADPNHILHDEFEWDDGVAGHHFRLMQAGALVRGVRLNIIRENKETRTIEINTTRAFQSRPSRRGTEGYEPIEEIMQDDEKKNEMVLAALKELDAIRRRYEELNELSHIWNLIDKAISKAEVVAA